ncbi:hypothetical protein NHX12_025479 [Muraenolepis orangiensis]|uniref:IRF tryptophan pentad repeat domain-containing protein n=1 Tax=Muraenolepis orangiensis TaxID=630683 RepID=A0A9Q0EPW6_9TELE|nr:hypothetical protein NHX12_025479 [Muraenolepis orangiensis]
MAQPKPLFMPWLRAQIDSSRFPGLEWTNPGRTEFSVPWKHALRQDSSSTDILIFKAWAEVTGSGQAQGDPSVWKRNFRSALRAKHFTTVTDRRNANEDPHKVFCWPETFYRHVCSLSAPPPVESQEEEELSQAVQEVSPVDCFYLLGDDTLLSEDTILIGATLNPDDLEDCLLGFNLQPPEEPQQPFEVLAGARLPWKRPPPSVTEEGGVAEPRATLVEENFKTQFRVSVFYRGLKVSETLASLTQQLLDSMGAGLEVGVSGSTVYVRRHGDTKAFWSRCRLDGGGQPQEVAKTPQSLFLFRDFMGGLLDFLGGGVCPSCCVVLCLGEKWPDPKGKPWEKKLLMVEVVFTSLEILKGMAEEGGASSLQSVELQLSLEEMMEEG